MIYKNNRRRFMDPNRINKYNKFLVTLDKKDKPTTVNSSVSSISKNKDEDTNKDTTKEDIDSIIDRMMQSFNINDYSSSNFTGQTNYDSIYANITIFDPNYYNELIKANTTFVYKPNYIDHFNDKYKNGKTDVTTDRKVDNDKKEKDDPDIRDTIFITSEINNISDILKLIKQYNLDPMIKYNINMKALHDIKEPLEELNNMIGMTNIKTNIIDQILYFVQGLHVTSRKNDKCCKNSSCDFMHTVIYGPPGTGKTDVAKTMGKIYSKLGILNKGSFTKVTRSDLIAGYLGQTALKTRDVIKDSLGGVLFIDEAYSLGNSDKKDSFSKECIDTLCEALSDHKDNLMVIIAGYEKELKECFFNQNQGLDSRFVWRFKTDEYSGEDLYHIFVKKVIDIGWEFSDNPKNGIEWFTKNKEYFRFYGRDVESVLAKTKIAHSKRVFCMLEKDKKKITMDDLENGFKIYLTNDDVKSRKDDEYKKKMLYATLYC